MNENPLSSESRDRRRGGQRGGAAASAVVMACLLCSSEPFLVRAGVPDMGGVAGGGVDATAPIEVKHADRLDYDRKNGRVDARGNVIIKKGADELSGDYVRVDMNTQEADAFGNVVLKRANGTWSGDRVHYNFRTKDADSDHFKIDMAPYHFAAESSQRSVSSNLYTMQGVVLTTCTNTFPDDCHYHVVAREMEGVPGQYFKAYGAVVYLGSVPVMYLPYWYLNLRDDIGFEFMPGYSSEMGAFLLTDFRYRLSPILRADTEIDYRTRRGVGIGEGLKWNDPAEKWFGDLRTYYISDQNPDDVYDDLPPGTIPSERYRVRVRQTNVLSDRDSLIVQANYLSDPAILEDFFESEYRGGIQPENYGVYTHREDNYTITALVRSRLNDFYNNINRLPEVAADFMNQPIGDTPLYYQGHDAASYLQNAHSTMDSNATDYSAFRLDSSHMISIPEKYFGFLNVNPRAGYEATYYSATLDSHATVRTTTTTNTTVDALGHTNATVTTTTVTSTNSIAAGAKTRSVVQLGTEVSYKAFATWDADGTPMRHVIEPYANYTYVPKVNLEPDNIYQFDSVDQLTEQNTVKVGARNKLQTKRGSSPYDLVDLDTYATFNVKPLPGQDTLSTVDWIGQVRAVEGLTLIFNGEATPHDGLTVFNIRMETADTNLWMGAMEYRYEKNSTSSILADLTLFPKARWTCNVYGRYEMENSQLEEIGGYLQRNYDCIGVRTGFGYLPAYTRTDGTQISDQWQVILGISLTAFPGGAAIGRVH